MVDVARMDAEVKVLLNKTLGSYNGNYRRNIRRVIVGTLDEAVRQGSLARHTLTGIELAPRILTAEQYERCRTGRCAPARTTPPTCPTAPLDTNPRELAKLSQVLGHDSVQTTLRFYIHPSANAEQRISAMMNTRWTSPPGPGA